CCEVGTAAAASCPQREAKEVLLEEVLEAVGVPDCFGLTRRVLAQVQRRASNGDDGWVGRGNDGLVERSQLVKAVVAVVACCGGDRRARMTERSLERWFRRALEIAERVRHLGRVQRDRLVLRGGNVCVRR